MADERAGAEGPHKDPADENRIQAGGRPENAAPPPNTAGQAGPERYPAVGQTDGVQAERRTFNPPADAPAPQRGACDSSTPMSTTDGRMGPGGDPAEGKR